MTGHVEIAGQLAAAGLLRFPAAIYSHEFWYVHIRPALASVLQLHSRMSAHILEYPSNGSEQSTVIHHDNPITEINDLMDDELQVGFNATHEGLDDEDEESSREIVRAANRFVVTTTQEEHYKYGSSALEFMSLYTYAGIVVVVTKNEQAPASSDGYSSETTGAGTKIQCNIRLRLAPSPFFNTHPTLAIKALHSNIGRHAATSTSRTKT